MSFIEHNKYDFDFYLQDGVLTNEQVEELRPLVNEENRFISKLQQIICDREMHERYNKEYFDNKSFRGNVTLAESGVDEKIIEEIQYEQTYHLRLLHASKIISDNEKNRIQSFIDRAIFKKPSSIFTLASTYKNQKKGFKNVRKKMDLYLEDNLLTSVPSNSEDVLDSFDFVKYHTYHKIFDPKDYLNEDGEKNVIALLKDIISFLPDKEIFGNVFTEIKEDGREIYYTVKKDIMITIVVNGNPISFRSNINYKYFDEGQKNEFRPQDGVWKFSEAADIFNKIYASLGKEYRLYIVSDSPAHHSNPHNENSRFAVVVESLKHGQIPWRCSNRHDPSDFKFQDKDIDDLVDAMKDSGLLQFYSSAEIEQGRHLGKTNFIYSPERILWFYDYFILAICPRENDSYQYFMNKIPQMIHRNAEKPALENWYEDMEKGILGFTLNGKKYETDRLLKNRCDPFFIFFINEALQDQGLGQFYHWQNEFDPHEQFSIIYSTPEVMKKIHSWRYPLPRFTELDDEIISFWRE